MTNDRKLEVLRIKHELEEEDLPDGAFWALLEERGVTVEDLEAAYEDDQAGP